jgi:predicted thioesterase
MPIGARGTAEETVALEHTLTAHHAELPPVYSTPDMIRLMETAAFHALQPYCEGDEITVGTAIHVEHRAASGIGARIRAEAVLESFDGKFYSVRVTARIIPNSIQSVWLTSTSKKRRPTPFAPCIADQRL